VTVETPENPTRDRQTKAAHRLLDPSIVKRCLATTRSGEPCKAHPLAGSTLCSLHTPGLASERGRRGGLNRRRPVPPPKVMPDPALPKADAKAAATAPAPPAGPMDAHQVRIYLENLTRNVAVGRLDPALARAATTAAAQWLRAIAMDEKSAEIEKRLAALEKRTASEKAK
jgi:hypothetical protein